MIKLFHGENYYALTKNLEKTIKDFKGQYSIFKIDGEEIDDINEIIVKISTLDLFSLPSLVIVKRFFQNPKKTTLEKELGKKLSSTDIAHLNIIFWEDGVVAKKKTSKLLNFIAEKGDIVEEKKLTPMKLKSWVKTYLAKSKIDITDLLVDEILIKLPNEQTIISSELEKLVLFCQVNNLKTVTSAIINEVVTIYEDTAMIWDLTDAFFSKDKKKSLRLLKILLKNPAEDFPLVIGGLLRQLKSIFIIKKFPNDREKIISGFKMHPFVYTKNSKFAHSFDMRMIKMIFSKLVNLDYMVKRGKIDVELGLTLLIATLQ